MVCPSKNNLHFWNPFIKILWKMLLNVANQLFGISWHCKPKWTSILGIFWELFLLGQCTKGIKRIMARKIKPKCSRQHQTESLMNIYLLSYLWIYNGVQFFLRDFFSLGTLYMKKRKAGIYFIMLWGLKLKALCVKIKADVNFGQNSSAMR